MTVGCYGNSDEDKYWARQLDKYLDQFDEEELEETENEEDEMRTYFDRYNILHHKPVIDGDPETSENGLLFSATYYCLNSYLNQETCGVLKDIIKVNELLWAVQSKKYGWINTPITKHGDISHDNYTGLFCLIHVFAPMFKKELKVFDTGRLHPRDIIFYGYAKYPWLFFPLLPIVSIIMIISCLRTWENKATTLRTSGKMLALTRCTAFNMKLTFKLCTWAIKRNKHFGSWGKVGFIYFKNWAHPTVRLLNGEESDEVYN